MLTRGRNSLEKKKPGLPPNTTRLVLPPLFCFSKNNDQAVPAGGDCVEVVVDPSSCLFRLPTEIIRMIVTYLSPAEFVNLALTSRQSHCILFHHCAMDISTAYPHLFFIHRPKGLFRGSWFSDRQVLKGIPADAFFSTPINVRNVKAIIILEEDIELTMLAAMELFSKMRFGGVTLEIKKRLPSTVTPSIFDHFLKTIRCGFVRMQINCFFRLQDVPSLDKLCFMGENWEDTSDESWKNKSFMGKFVILQELPNLKIIENTLKQFMIGNLVSFFHAFTTAPGAQAEVARLSVQYGHRVQSTVGHANGFRTVTFKAGKRRLKMTVGTGGDFNHPLLLAGHP